MLEEYKMYILIEIQNISIRKQFMKSQNLLSKLGIVYFVVVLWFIYLSLSFCAAQVSCFFWNGNWALSSIRNTSTKSRDAARFFGLKSNAKKQKYSQHCIFTWTKLCSGNHWVSRGVQVFGKHNIHNTDSCHRKDKVRIDEGNASFRRLNQSRHNRHYSLRNNLRLFNNNFLLTPCYGSKTRNLDQHHERKLLALENTCLRHILDIYQTQNLMNATARLKISLPLITEVIKCWKWRYLGHLIHMPETQLPKVIFQWPPDITTRRELTPQNTPYEAATLNWPLKLQCLASTWMGGCLDGRSNEGWLATLLGCSKRLWKHKRI